MEFDDTGQTLGTLQSIEGGAFKSDVVEEKVGGSALVTKYSGRPKLDDVTIQVGMSMAPRFWTWLSKSFNYNAQRHNGSLIALDFDNKERWRRNFSNALVKEVTFPALDGAAKEPAYLTVKFAVEDMTEDTSRIGQSYPPEQETTGEWPSQVLWLPSMFTFRVDGLTKDQAETCKIDSFSIKQEVIDVAVGGQLLPTKEPGRVDFPALAVTILQRDADPWMQWWNNFVRQGSHQQSNQKTGHISFLPRTAKGPGILSGTPLMTLNLYGIGILGVSPVKHDSKQPGLQKVKLDLYIERMDLQPGTGTVSAS